MSRMTTCLTLVLFQNGLTPSEVAYDDDLRDAVNNAVVSNQLYLSIAMNHRHHQYRVPALSELHQWNISH